MTQWLSANNLVKEALEDFVGHFSKQEQRNFASGIREAMLEFNLRSIHAPDNSIHNTPQSFRSITIKDFRNLNKVKFDFGPQFHSHYLIHHFAISDLQIVWKKRMYLL